MNKKFIIRQCSRLKKIHNKESEKIIQDKQPNSKWILIHNEGHDELICDFIKFVDNCESFNKNLLKKWLRKRISKSEVILLELDKKYNNFINNELMSLDDEKKYFFNDGIRCISITLINIINGERYISKLVE